MTSLFRRPGDPRSRSNTNTAPKEPHPPSPVLPLSRTDAQGNTGADAAHVDAQSTPSQPSTGQLQQGYFPSADSHDFGLQPPLARDYGRSPLCSPTMLGRSAAISIDRLSPDRLDDTAGPSRRTQSHEASRRSPSGSPKSGEAASPHLKGSSPPSAERRIHSPRHRHGSSSARMASPDETERRKQVLTEAKERQKTSPLATRLGEDVPFMLPYASQSQHLEGLTGVMIGGDLEGASDSGAGEEGGNALDLGMGDIDFDGSMEGILDPSAAPRTGVARNNSANGQAGANIAPWLTDDEPRGSTTPTPDASGHSSRQGSIQALNHSSSVPGLPKIMRQATVDPLAETASGSSSRSGSNPNIYASNTATDPSSSSSSTRDASRTRTGSADSMQTLGAPKGLKVLTPVPAGEGSPQGHASRQASLHGHRMSRFGSTASNVSGNSGSIGSEKKKGIFNVFKRKTGQSVSTNHGDFGPSDGSHRGSTSGSTSSRMSASGSANSLSHKLSHPLFPPDMGGAPNTFDRPHPQGGYLLEGGISPLHEIGEPEFQLDMNLDDMEGIVDPTRANAPPTAPYRDSGPSTAGPTTEISAASMFLQDALDQTGSFTTTTSGSGGSSGSGRSGSSGAPVAATGRAVVSEAQRISDPQFARNIFSGPPITTSSSDQKSLTPPSPHTLSPKHHLPPSTQPRRPSQLRNVKMGSMDSESSTSADGSVQPLMPAWASGAPLGHTLFNDPFGSGNASRPSAVDGLSPSRPPTRTAMNGQPNDPASVPPSAIPPGSAAGAGAAWAAPESWGVEGDDESDDTSSSEEDEWVADDGGVEPEPDAVTPHDSLQPPSSSSPRKPPPFGFKSKDREGSGTRPATVSGRGRANGGRTSASARPGATGRPGTSGSTQGGSTLHYIRIYRADGSYQILAFPLSTTTAEVIQTLSGGEGGKKVSTSMKLYLRERGQDRQLQPSEKPLAIQNRRLQQAGFTEAEKIEELGKLDLAILCKFIYQTPVLPVMDPEEESSYDSFEFIDIAGRDLQTIPIFLHLHAHNIIILNVSRNPMTDLPLDFIQACTSLKELRMSYMALKRVPVSIRASTTLARLDVSCNRIADLESVPLHEISTLLSLKIQNNKLTSIPKYFAQMKALKYLNISNNKFEAFPAVVCEMSTLVDLDVSFNNIAELPSEMSNLKSLERFAVFGNDLTRFPASFSTLANLRVLDVRRNRLTNLDSVYALPNLGTLLADNNNLVTLDAQIGAKVRQFSVPHNSITRFTLAPLDKTAAVTHALTHLNLSHGKISTLADEAFSGLSNLVELNLNFNQFTRLPPTLELLVNLEVFSCTDNLLNSLPTGFSKLSKLRIINVHNNNLKVLPGDMWMCGSLESFNASSNLLEVFPDIPEDLMTAYATEMDRKPSVVSQSSVATPRIALPPIGSSLQLLYLADNRYSDDIFHWMESLPNLRVLNLSFNDIYEIPSYTLRKLESLEQLYLSGNKLTSLPSEDLEKLQKLKVLHLNGNKLQTLPSELGAIKTLQHLDVGSNVLKYNIANWPYDWNWNWNTALRYLNLSGNKRLEIKPTSAQDMSHASSFRKELSDFTALSQLRLLGLMDVTLRIPSLPDESEEKRVRTSFSDINHMKYGISDMLGSIEHLAMFDMVIPNFRGKDNECVFGMFGRAAPSAPSGRIPKYLQESFANMLTEQLERLQEGEDAAQALRRSFIFSNRKTFEYLSGVSKDRKPSTVSISSIDSLQRNWAPAVGSPFRTGASGAVVYLVDKTLYVGNVGDTLVVLSRKGEAELLSKHHDPTDREETARIRRAEAWVSTKGYVNDDKDIDISRAFGYWQNSPAVNASPEIRKRQLAESDEFIIIGNHALWKCCSYQTAVDIARTERDDPMLAAQKLRDFAISYGADGSVMVMVVNVSDLFFGRGPRPRGLPGSGPQTAPDTAQDAEYYGATKRNVRRRYEEVGDRTLNRLQQEIEPPTGQVAIVFTDIVNSTVLWETNPGMPTAIKMHHSLMRRQLRLDGGYEVKTEGDSFMVSFQTVTAAVLWCFNCQVGLLQQEWPRELLEAHDGKTMYDSEGNLIQRGLRVRMGVHWGAPQCERDPITRRMDYYGPMVNRAARINASADGGQLMASQDVIKELQDVWDYVDHQDEAGMTDLPAEMKREFMELKRIGLEMKDMGERKLKGLEVPEKLHLLYPRTLAGRLEYSGNDLRANVEVNQARLLIGLSPRQIDIEQVRDLVKVVLRLEAISSATATAAFASAAGAGSSSAPITSATIPKSPSVGYPPPSAPPNIASPQALEKPPSTRLVSGNKAYRLPLPPSYLGPHVREDMEDEELLTIIESLITRMENCTSSLYIKNLGGFSSVLAALEQATKIDQKLIVHALSLMSGSMR